MKAMNSAMVVEETDIDSKITFEAPVHVESKEEFFDCYEEPEFFFKGAVFGLFLCVPFWAVIFWLII